MTMKPSATLLLLVSVTCLFFFAEAVIQGSFRAFCSSYENQATDKKPCPTIHKPVCGTNGQTYQNPCEFCKAALAGNGKLGFKHEGKC